MPQDYLIVFLVLGVIAIVITSFVAIHHWVKNSGRKREKGEQERNGEKEKEK